jgi:hypothetical protein
MLRSIHRLTGHPISCSDGNIGKTSDFLFDDEFWCVRYVVADTRRWLPGRSVLLSPAAFMGLDPDKGDFRVSLSREQIRQSPPIEEDQPVHRQMEQRLAEHFDWPAYWMLHRPAETVMRRSREAPAGRETGVEVAEAGDPHLRSTREVTGYHIESPDGEIGHLHDFIVDDYTWAIRYLVVDTRNVLPGRKVLVSPTWVEDIRWNDSRVRVVLFRDEIRGSPEYDPFAPIEREYETRLHEHYGRPTYWE